MSRAWTLSGPWEPLTEEELASLAFARAKFAQTRTWAYCIGRMRPERLAQQRAYDRERHKSYHEEQKQSITQYSKDWRDKNKEQLCERHAC